MNKRPDPLFRIRRLFRLPTPLFRFSAPSFRLLLKKERFGPPGGKSLMKSIKKFGAKAVKVIKKAAKKTGTFLKKNQKTLKKLAAVAAVAGVGYVGYKMTVGKADEINKTPYRITRIENGKDESEFIVTYDHDQSFSVRDKFTVSDTDCDPALPPTLTGKDTGPRQVTLTGTKTKLKTPCTKGTLRVLTSAAGIAGGAVKDTVGAVVNTGVDIAKDAGEKVGKGIFEMIASMIGVNTDTLKQIGYVALFLVCLGLAYKLYTVFS